MNGHAAGVIFSVYYLYYVVCADTKFDLKIKFANNKEITYTNSWYDMTNGLQGFTTSYLKYRQKISAAWSKNFFTAKIPSAG